MDVSNKNPIAHILAQQVIPAVTKSGAEHIVVASSSFDELSGREDLPPGMHVTHRPLRSRRVKVRSRQYFGKNLLVNACWPEDGLHSLRTPKLAIVLKGDVTFQCGDALLHCKPRHIIFIPPDTPHSDGSHNYLEETASPQGNCDMLFVGIHADGIVVWLSVTRQGEHYSNGTYRLSGGQIELFLGLLWEHVISAKEYAHQNSGALLLLLLTAIYNALQEYQPMRAIQEEATIPAQGRIARAKEYIHNHIHKRLTIDEVARHAYLSRTQFTRQFRGETGKSFHEYLSDCRFELAKTLLLDPVNWSIYRISRRVGLNPGMLRKLFHQRLQMTPTQFRESRQIDSASRPCENKGRS